jgi:hypothetical protein
MSVEDLNPVRTKYHHPKPKEVVAAWDGRKPFYSVIRNPYNQVLSWFYHAKKGGDESDFLEFVSSYNNGWLFEGLLNIYESVPGIEIQYLVYEDGLDVALDKMGLANVKTSLVGATYPNYNLLTDKAKEVIVQRFSRDVDLYLEACTKPRQERPCNGASNA